MRRAPPARPRSSSCPAPAGCLQAASVDAPPFGGPRLSARFRPRVQETRTIAPFSGSPESRQVALIVQKFGGTSVGSVERIRNVAWRVAKWHAAGHRVVVVPSAMAGETNRL